MGVLKVRARLKPALAVAWFSLVGITSLAAQETSSAPQMAITAPSPSSSSQKHTPPITVEIQPPPISLSSAAIGMAAPIGAQPVEGKPILAEFVTENHQKHEDGNGIARPTTTTSVIYRDTQGRVRRESQLLLPGLHAEVIAKFVTIIDRRQGFGWVLDPQEMTARRYRLDTTGPSYVARLTARGNGGQLLPKSDDSGANATAKAGEESRCFRPPFASPALSLPPEAPNAISAAPGQTVAAPATTGEHDEESGSAGATRQRFEAGANPVHTENLGEQMILGYRVHGTRVITTLAPGEIGNDQPIDIVSEQWFSPDLDLVMRSLHRDPWGGEFITMVTKVRRGEQPAGLFTIPAQYKLVDADTEQANHLLLDSKTQSH